MTETKPDLKEVIKLAIETYLTALLQNYQAGLTPYECKIHVINKVGKDPKAHENEVLMECLAEALVQFEKILKDPEAVKELKALSH